MHSLRIGIISALNESAGPPHSTDKKSVIIKVSKKRIMEGDCKRRTLCPCTF